jgi:hypothetical protein
LKSSWSVLRQDPKLMVFPVVSMTALILVLATFMVPFFVDHNLARSIADKQGSGRILAYVFSFLFYLASNFVIIFFNVALISCVMRRFRGESSTLGDGLSAAMSRLPQIIGWAFVAATVGMILRAIEERVPAVGKIVVRLVGMAWAAVTYFVTPVLVVEGLGPKDALTRSAELLKRTWGESLVGQVSLGLFSFIAVLPGFVFLIAGVAIGTRSNPPSPAPIILGTVAFFLWVALIAIISSVLRQIFVAGSYVYAAEGRVPSGFEPELVQTAFAAKR